jgi:hypothetical protein
MCRTITPGQICCCSCKRLNSPSSLDPDRAVAVSSEHCSQFSPTCPYCSTHGRRSWRHEFASTSVAGNHATERGFLVRIGRKTGRDLRRRLLLVGNGFSVGGRSVFPGQNAQLAVTGPSSAAPPRSAQSGGTRTADGPSTLSRACTDPARNLRDKQTSCYLGTPTAAKTVRAALRRGQGCAANRTPPGPISPGNGALNL